MCVCVLKSQIQVSIKGQIIRLVCVCVYQSSIQSKRHFIIWITIKLKKPDECSLNVSHAHKLPDQLKPIFLMCDNKLLMSHMHTQWIDLMSKNHEHA